MQLITTALTLVLSTDATKENIYATTIASITIEAIVGIVVLHLYLKTFNITSTYDFKTKIVLLLY